MPSTSSTATRVITLGVAGGPRWWPATASEEPSGIATAVVVGDAFYLIDAGSGTGRNLVRAGLPMERMRAMFITHLHSDHVAALPSLLLFSSYEAKSESSDPIRIIGPGDRGTPPPLSEHAAASDGTAARTPLYPEKPTPGTADMVDLLFRAFATDLNDRYLDGLKPTAKQLFTASDIPVPTTIGYHPDDDPAPEIRPFTIYEDDRVRVLATLALHPPVAPAFGFRIETDDGVVAISGDTTFTPNMIALADNADILLHEAIDEEWIDAVHGSPTDPVARASRAHHLRSHTTVADALRVADSASAKQLLLHHIVPGNNRSSIQAQLSAVRNSRASIPHDRDEFILR